MQILSGIILCRNNGEACPFAKNVRGQEYVCTHPKNPHPKSSCGFGGRTIDEENDECDLYKQHPKG
jgi:hypothetical protein